MNRREFINLLTDSLAGRVPNGLISEKVDYYRNYISQCAADNGVSEEDVIEEMGAPELIAHTIIDVYEAEHGVYEGNGDSIYNYGRYTDSKEESSTARDLNQGLGKIFTLSTGNYGCLIALFVVMVVFLTVGSWIVRFVAAYPGVVLTIAILIYGYNYYKRRR